MVLLLCGPVAVKLSECFVKLFVSCKIAYVVSYLCPSGLH